MRKASLPSGRRGLRPWGLSHSYNFRKEGVNNEKRVLFTMESVYSIRVRLPKYVHAIYYGGLLKEKEIQDYGINWAKKLNSAVGLNMAAKVMDYNFRSSEPEITIDLIVKDTERDMTNFIKHVLPIVKQLLEILLNEFRTILRKYLENNAEYMGYFVIKLDGTPTKNGAIRWRRPRLRGKKSS